MHPLTNRIGIVAIVCAMTLGGDKSVAAQTKTSLNVLLIAVDDLRPELGCYGAKQIQSPNIDRFAKSAIRFERAYCQQAVCNPSRTSFMTGMRPDSIGVTGNHSHFRAKHPDIVTLPQHFKNHGYHAAAIGKIYHGVFPDGSSKTKWDTMGDPESWSEPAIRFGPRYYYTEEGIAAAKVAYERTYQPKKGRPNDWTKKLVFAMATESPDVPDNQLYDGKVADAAISKLKKLAQKETPFFLAVGFIKPHSPYIAPKKYFDLYQDVAIERGALSSDSRYPSGAPAFAGHRSGELRRYSDQPNSGGIPQENQRRVRQAYFACVSYIDAQIGRVLNQLDQSGISKNSIVVLLGDHGYHLGEQGLWGKTTNFELDTRVPLLVRAPGMKLAGKSASSLVELVDVFPTLAELAGLPVPKQLEGESFVSILKDPTATTKTAALSQYPRGKSLMGYSMRTSTHRLTQWIDRQSGELKGTELYDYANGLVESENIASKSPSLVGELSRKLVGLFGLSNRSQQPAKNDSDSQLTESFESAKAGSFKELKTKLGIWKSTEVKVLIDDKHAKSGRHCLQLTGGKKTTVILELATGTDTSGELSFWAERWTKRSPFSFRIEKDSSGKWEEVFNGDKRVQVGRAFLSHVKIPLGDSAIKRLRFSVSSPPSTGILLDDFRFSPATPQKIVGVESVPLTLPALVGVPACPLIKFKVTTEGSLAPISLTQLRTSLLCESGDVESAQIYFSGSSNTFSKAKPLGKAIHLRAFNKSDTNTTVDLSHPLADGVNYFWITCKLKPSDNIDHRVGASCSQVAFSNGKSVELKSVSHQRIGIAIRNGGDDGVNRFRIPGLATTNRGTLIAVYDIRRRNGGDLPGDIDVGLSRSTDQGRTWEPMKVIMDMGDDPKWRYDGIGDPAVLVDKGTGTIWVAATWSHGNRSWVGSGPGLSPEETGQLMLVRSDDDGVTWSKPINITKQVKKKEWCFLLQGPGKGITMRDGTIVFAAQYQDPPNETNRTAHRLPHSTILYSKDHGKTWQVGNGAFDDTTESQVVEVEPGLLMLNCRYNRKPVRVVMTTRDMGKTWQKHTTSERSLIEPGSCMASLINVDQEVGKRMGDWLLFSNPDSRRGRNHITIKASRDGGLTWPKENRILLDEETGAGYSCMSMIDEETVGILYEGSRSQLTFQRIKLNDLTSPDSNEEHERAVDQSRIKQSSAGQTPLPELDSKSLKLPPVFGHHMVLQADHLIPVWGNAKANAAVKVTFGSEEKEIRADENGHWRVRLKKRKYNAISTSLTIESGDEKLQFDDVLIGEVWVCAGQSNMEWTLAQSQNGAQELAKANYPNMRLLHLAGGARGSSGSYSATHLARLTPQTYCQGKWEVASSHSARTFSAVAWYFGRYLERELGVPVGLICPAVGGTPTEAWISSDALRSDKNSKGLVAGNWLDNHRLGEFCRTRGEQNLLNAIQTGEKIPGDQYGPNHSFKPGFMWDAGIKPLIPFGIRGVIWYQGESNAENLDRAKEHSQLFPLLINQWRKEWNQGEFPFLFVQLPALNRSAWPAFREGQRRTLSKVNNVGMAIAIDTGHRSDVHPKLKKPVGERLAKWALGTTYQLKQHRNFSGPLFESAKRRGRSLELNFIHVAEGLTSSDGKPIGHFEVCGEDGVFHNASAEIVGRSVIRLTSSDVAKPTEARYAWKAFPDPPVNLFNSVGLPAAPMTTHKTDAVFAAKGANHKRPNILFLVSEDNGDHLGCYGERRVHTPHLDALAQGGTRYKNAFVPYSVCSPSRAAFLTGMYPRQTGHIGLATHRFSMFRDFKTMPAYFKDAGYFTGFLGKTHINPERLVEEFVDHRAISASNFGKTISIEEYANQAGKVMRKATENEKPFFLIVNFADAHRQFIGKSKNGFPSKLVNETIDPFPWIGSDTAAFRKELQNYFNCINRLDEGVGLVLDQLRKTGAQDNTLVIYISDHGADFPRGKGSVYENGTRIPMIVNYPNGFESSKVEDRLVSTIDILPTMLKAANISIPKRLPGIALQDLQTGKAVSRKYIHTFTTGSSPNLLYVQFAVRDQRYKLIYNPDRAPNRLAQSRYKNSNLPSNQHVQSFLFPKEFELFDLKKDPHEWNNLADSPDHRQIRARLHQAMRDFQNEIDDPFANRENLDKFIAEQKEFQTKPYRNSGFRWPHLEMFQESNLTN